VLPSFRMWLAVIASCLFLLIAAYWFWSRVLGVY
jgi:hypothetical protein